MDLGAPNKEKLGKEKMKHKDVVGGSVADHGEAERDEMNKVEEPNREGDDKNDKENSIYLCTIMCDFFCGLAPKPSLWCETNITQKVLSGFRKCDKDVPCDLGDNTIAIDIRGRHVDDALTMMMRNLYCCSGKPGIKSLYVTVGCKVHGCGEGKLFKAVTDLLELRKTIRCDKLYNGAIISIPLEGKDRKSLRWTVDGSVIPLPHIPFPDDPLIWRKIFESS